MPSWRRRQSGSDPRHLEDGEVKQARGRVPGDMGQEAEEGVGDDGDEVERGCVVAARRATVSGG